MISKGLYRLAGTAMFALSFLCSCEGIDRKHDARVVDVQPPSVDELDAPKTVEPAANFPDLVEDMMARRQAYLEQLVAMERAYLKAGDTSKANWARRQRDLTTKVAVYPYLTTTPAEERAEVTPREKIAAADTLYDQAVAIRTEVGAVPLAGGLPGNQKRAREAMEIFKRILRDYPTSDKVDDSAFYCGEIYKEYLREDDPDDELAMRYYRWALSLDPHTPHPVRFQLAVVLDFRRHDRTKALELYHQVIDIEEDGNRSNQRFAASRIEQLSDEDFSHLRPDQPRTRTVATEARNENDAPKDVLPEHAEPVKGEPEQDEGERLPGRDKDSE
jgi:tetratricopeptide (TPR) repeat protein